MNVITISEYFFPDRTFVAKVLLLDEQNFIYKRACDLVARCEKVIAYTQITDFLIEIETYQSKFLINIGDL